MIGHFIFKFHLVELAICQIDLNVLVQMVVLVD